MTLPTQDEIERVLRERPGDEVYASIKEYLPDIQTSEQELKPKLISLILTDLIQDLSLANSLDEVGKILEYLSQEQQIERPEFLGDMLMRNLSRIAKLKLSLDFAALFNITEGKVFDAILKAEVERLWGDHSSAILKKLLMSKGVSETMPVSNGVKFKK